MPRSASNYRAKDREYSEYFKHMAGMTDFLDALRRGEQPPEYESVLFRIAAINMVPPRTHREILAIVDRAIKHSTVEIPDVVVSAYKAYSALQHNKRSQIRMVKRNLVELLGLGISPPTIAQLESIGVAIVVWEPEQQIKNPIKSHTWLIDAGNEDLITKDLRFAVVPADSSWTVVNPTQSVVFLDKEGTVQLGVLRGRCSKYPQILAYIAQVIQEAITDRRGVRPTHPGSMVQYGQNAGPHHLRVFGHVHNLKNAKISKTEQAEKDCRLLGVFGIVWNLFLAIVPAPVIDACNQAMDKADIPRMEAIYDENESGYTLELDGESISFNAAIRAPCEGYVLQDYAAPVHTDRSWTGYSLSLSTTYTSINANIPPNGTGGGNYVDVDMKVVVMMDSDTALITSPNHRHGITLPRSGVERNGIAHNWGSHILEAYQKASNTFKKDSGELLDVKVVSDM